MAFIYPIILPGTHDPIWLRLTIVALISLVYCLAIKYDLIRDNIIHFTVYLYYVVTSHTIYLIYVNNMAVEYVVGLVIIVGTGHVIFSNFKQVFFFLTYLIFFCLLVTYKLSDPVVSPGTFLISVLIIGLFAFISLVLRFNLSRHLILSSFIIESINEGILGVSMDDTITYANGNIDKVIGYTKDEIIGTDVKKLLATEQDQDIVVGKTDLRKKGISEKYELNFRHRNGETITTEVNARPTYDGKGIADGSVAVITNITARKKVEHELRKQSIIANKTDSYVILADANDQIEYVNHSFEKYTGYSFEEVKGRKAEDFLHGIDTNQNTVKAIKTKREQNTAFSEEIKNYTKNGKVIWLSIHVTPLKDENNEVTGYITIGNDITIRKQAEEKLRSDSFRLGIIREIDAAIIASQSLTELAYSTISYLNKLLPSSSYVNISVKNDNHPEFTIITKQLDFKSPFRKLPDHIIKKLIDGEHHKVRQLSVSKQLSALDNEIAQQGIESYVLIPLLYNEELMGTLNIFSKEDDQNLLEYVELIQGTGRDLAIGIKQFSLQDTIATKNDELESRLKELETTHEELQNFSYIVSHDLKAPLRAISSLAQWLENDYRDRLGAEGQEYLSMLVNRTDRLHHLIEGVLEYSRIGRRDLEKKNIDVMSLIKTTLDLLTIPESVAIIIEDDLPEVWFNPTQLQQVFQNLIGNSIKFMNKSDGEVRISCSQREGEAKFSIEDNGPGISQDHSEKIFKIFQTLHARDDIESTGIGLTIVKKIIELNSGKIWLDTSYTEGTRLYFTIPVSRKEPINAPRYA